MTSASSPASAPPAWRQHSLGGIAIGGRGVVDQTGRPRALRHLWCGRLRQELSEASKAFGKAYREAYKTAPDIQNSWTFDAVTILSAAINKAGSADPGKIRVGDLSLKKFPGAEGEYNFDQNGDGLHGYNVVRNEKGTVVFDKHIEFDD